MNSSSDDDGETAFSGSSSSALIAALIFGIPTWLRQRARRQGALELRAHAA